SLAVDFVAGQQVVDRPHVLVDLQSAERPTDRQERRGGHVAMILAQRLADAPLARPEGVDREDEEAQLRQPDAAGLYVGILLGALPVTVDAEDRGPSAFAVGVVG